MLSIYTSPEIQSALLPLIQAEDRLEELIKWPELKPAIRPEQTSGLFIKAQTTQVGLDWWDKNPPLLLPEISSQDQSGILALVYYQLGNEVRALEILAEDHDLYPYLEFSYALKFGQILPTGILAQLPAPDPNPENQYRYAHNQAVIAHYGQWENALAFSEVEVYYKQALHLAPDTDYYTFSLKQYASGLLDQSEPTSRAIAESLILENLAKKPSEAAAYALKQVLFTKGIEELQIPYDREGVKQLEHLAKDCIQYAQSQEEYLSQAYLLVDASRLSSIMANYSEAISCINRALEIFKQEEIPVLQGDALLQKANFLHTWAQNGQAHFFKAALDAYQEALVFFKKRENPEIYAEIQHHLGVIYTKLKGDPAQEAMWAARSAQAFKEALAYYTKADFPYEYGMICSNYANALIQYPTAAHTDNFANALKYYQEALDVRSADHPYERAITLLNYLEANWFVLEDKVPEQERLQDMRAKALEIEKLVQDPELLQEAKRHLNQLEVLEKKLNVPT